MSGQEIGSGEVGHIDLRVTPSEPVTIDALIGYPIAETVGRLFDRTDGQPFGGDGSFCGLHIGGIDGPFEPGERPGTWKLLAGEPYALSVGVTTPSLVEESRKVIDTVINDGAALPISGGTLKGISESQTVTTRQELLERADEMDVDSIPMWFRTPTCLDPERTHTLYPHRGAVFESLLEIWNAHAPPELTWDVSRDRIEDVIRERPVQHSIETTRVAIERTRGDSLRTRWGFTGGVQYEFVDPTPAERNALFAAALLGRYGGIGHYRDRGCGDIAVGVAVRQSAGVGRPVDDPIPGLIRRAPFPEAELS